jgi:L,D-transpeptidase catalytic domain
VTDPSSVRGHRKTRNGSGPSARSLLVLLTFVTLALASPAQASRWAFVDARVTAHTLPSADSGVVTRLGTQTQDGTDELVLILDQRRARDGVWLKVRLPVLPNNTTGWVKASRLSRPRTVNTWLRVNRAKERMTLTRDGRVIFRARIGVGRPESPTPAGNFYIRDKLTGFPPGTLYGPLAFGTSARSAVLTDWPKDGVIGIHGTNEPGLLPGHVSHGCMRLRNADILRLAKLLPIGTPLTIT